MDTQKNADRFTGFADDYEATRPRLPRYPIDVICRYLGRTPQRVIDLGSGTGLSSAVWLDVSDEVIGVEPSDDMRRIAETKAGPRLRFIKAFAHDTGLPDACADVVVCSQSFHWMEPVSTLNEVSRLLRRGGVFAAIDFDWPPVARWEAEQAYQQMFRRAREIEAAVPEIRDTFVRYPKDGHLKQIQSCGHFSYARELVFAGAETCTRERFQRMIYGQGSIQTILKKRPELLEREIAAFHDALQQIYDDTPFPVEFCYRMRLGVK